MEIRKGLKVLITGAGSGIVAGLTGAPWHGPYAAAKWGLVGLSEVLRYDFMQHQIGVTLLCRGAVETPLKHTVQIVAAIRKNRFMVLTSFDVKLLYFAKQELFRLYHQVMIRISRMLNEARS